MPLKLFVCALASLAVAPAMARAASRMPQLSFGASASPADFESIPETLSFDAWSQLFGRASRSEEEASKRQGIFEAKHRVHPRAQRGGGPGPSFLSPRREPVLGLDAGRMGGARAGADADAREGGGGARRRHAAAG